MCRPPCHAEPASAVFWITEPRVLPAHPALAEPEKSNMHFCFFAPRPHHWIFFRSFSYTLASVFFIIFTQWVSVWVRRKRRLGEEACLRVCAEVKAMGGRAQPGEATEKAPESSRSSKEIKPCETPTISGIRFFPFVMTMKWLPY